MTTLDDMTQEEAAQCIGMWCEWDGPGLAVLTSHSPYASCLLVTRNGSQLCTHFPGKITPRTDLPRAWQPDGKPVKGQWDYESNCIIDHGGRTVRTLTSRRFVGEWEGEWEEE